MSPELDCIKKFRRRGFSLTEVTVVSIPSVVISSVYRLVKSPADVYELYLNDPQLLYEQRLKALGLNSLQRRRL